MWLRVLRFRSQRWVAMIATVVIAWTATTTIHAAVIVRSNGGVSAAADARANRIPMENGKPVIGGESDRDSDSRSDLGTVTTVTVGAAASVSGASATSGSSVSATVTADTAADTLEIVAAGSTSLFAVSNAPTSDSFFSSNANGNSFFAQEFDLTERSYEYTLSADTEVSVTQTQAGSDAKAFIRLQNSGTFDTLIDQSIDERGLLFSMGALSGVLAPGRYAISGHSGGSYQNGQADATFALLFELTSASRWIDPAGGTFRVADNWEASIVPGVTDVAIFDLPGTYTVQLDQDVTNKRLRANGAGVNVSLDLNGNDYVLDEISVGGLDGDSVSVTFADTSDPIVSAASASADDGFAQVAANGVAERRLRARLLKARKGGTANVDIPIETTRGIIDDGGRVNVKGRKGLWDVFELRVGDVGFAELFIEDRAIVDAEAISIGGFQGSSGYTEVSDATLIQHGAQGVTVGGLGAATLAVKNKGLVDVEKLTIGELMPGNGRVTVDSLGELRVNGRLIVSPEGFGVGPGGIAQLVINGGSAIQTVASGSTSISFRGVLEVLDGHFHEAHELKVNGTLALDRTDGSASVGNNPVKLLGNLSVGSGGTLKGNGIIRGKVKVLANSTGTNQFVGQVLPGLSPGTLTIEGDYEQTGGLLGIEVAGTAPGQFDVLVVTGNATLGGDLLLEFIDGFAPRQGDEFKFLDVGGALSGAFASVAIRNLAPDFQFDLRPDANGLTMVALNDGVFVPEPATWVLLIVAALGIRLRRRRIAW